MSGETRSAISGWTVDTLKEHVDKIFALLNQVQKEANDRYGQRFEAQQEALSAALLAAKEAVQTALQSAEKAVAKAEMAADKRFEGINELRGMATDMAERYAPREALQNVNDKIDGPAGLSQRLTAMEARTAGMSAGAQANWGYVVGAAGLAAYVYTIFGTHTTSLVK